MEEFSTPQEIPRPKAEELVFRDPETGRHFKTQEEMEIAQQHWRERKEPESLIDPGLYPVSKEPWWRRKSSINKLIKIANRLDKLGMHKEADEIDSLIKKLVK